MEIPKQLQDKEFRFVLIKSKTKAPYEMNWTKINNYPYNKVFSHKGNLGIVCGYGNLIVLDIDSKKFIEEFDKKTNTFTVVTGSGGRHYYLICEKTFMKNYYVLGKGAGELRVKNSQVVTPGSIHPNSNKYKVFRDTEIQKITKTELKNLLGDLLNKEEKISDVSRSGQDWHDVCETISANYSFDDCDRELMLIGSSRWQAESMNYKVGTYCNALKFIKKVR